MRILSLNTWGGRAGKEKLLGFLERESTRTDVFCLQEVWSAPYENLEGAPAGGLAINHDNIMVYGKQEISELLSDFEYFFHPHHLDNYGLMTLVKRGVTTRGSGDVFVYKHAGYVPEGDVAGHARNLQYVEIAHGNTNLTVCNFHGLWNGKGKGDSNDRLAQSDNILAFLKQVEGEAVLIGDFNLLPNTESLKRFERAGYRNLILEHGITSTRTSYYAKPEKHADYAFVNSAVSVQAFSVLTDEVSDHAPLALEIA